MFIFIAAGSFIFACTLFFFGRTLAERTALMDKPGGRKHHDVSVPLIGGLIIIPLFILSVLAAGYGGAFWVLLCACMVLLLMGVFDDAFQLNPYFKFAVQVFISCFVVIFGPLEIDTLGNLFGLGEVRFGYFAKPFSVMCLVLFMNAMNMMDGLDGLAGGLTAGMLFIMLGVATAAGAEEQVAMLSFVLAPLLAFLVYNMRYPGHKKASVFMGDAGSLTLGLILGWFAISLSQDPLYVLTPAVVPWIVGLPVADTLSLYVYRTSIGKKPFEPDRNHLHHRFLNSGVSAGKTAAVLICFMVVSALAALWLDHMKTSEVLVFSAWLVFFFIHMALVFRPQRYARVLRRFA